MKLSNIDIFDIQKYQYRSITNFDICNNFNKELISTQRQVQILRQMIIREHNSCNCSISLTNDTDHNTDESKNNKIKIYSYNLQYDF